MQNMLRFTNIVICRKYIVKKTIAGIGTHERHIYVFDGGETMKDCRLYIFTALFLCLTAVKLCFPAIPERASREIGRMICCEADYGEAIQAMGRALSRGELVQTLHELGQSSGQGLVSALGQSGQAEPLPSPTPVQP